MRLAIAILTLSVIICIGCSGGKSPVSPDVNQTAEFSGNLPLIGLSESGESSNALGLAGVFELIVNPESESVELVTKRISSLGQSYLVSGLSYFTSAPCKDCLIVTGIGMTAEGYVKVTFDVKHPFPKGDPLKPPSGSNRLDLDIFDVALIIVPSNQTTSYFPRTFTSAYSEICPHADGLTRELMQITEDNAACPYYLIVDDSETGVNTFNKFEMGQSESVDIYLNTDGVMTFDLYLTMGFGASAMYITRLEPEYFNPEFNRKSAWKVDVIPPEGDDPAGPDNTWTDFDSTTPRTVTVKVWDWQHGCTDIANPPVNYGDIAFPSDVVKVQVEIPGMMNSLPQVDTAVSGTGCDADDPLVFEVEITNERLLDEGKYSGLVKVLDERVPPPVGEIGITDTLIDIPDGVTFNWVGIPEFATYQVFTATIANHPCMATGGLITPAEDIYETRSGELVDFLFEAQPIGGDFIAYWVDWGSGDYTESSLTGEFQYQFDDPNCPEFADDTYLIRFGIELDCNEGSVIDVDEITVNVTECPLCYGDGSITYPSEDVYEAESTEIIDFVIDISPVGGSFRKFWADWGSGEFTESNSTPQFSHQFIDTDCPFTADDTYNVRFAAELDCYPGNIVEFDSLVVNISECPPCDATGEITYPAGTQYDAASGEQIDFVLDVVPNGGDVLAYWADWGTGIYVEAGDVPVISHRFYDDDCPSYADDSYDVRFAIELDCAPGYLIELDAITIDLTYCPGAPNAVDDLIMQVNRKDLAGRFAIDTEKPFTLSWVDPGGETFDYAIYRDSDPSDGLTNHFEPVGVSPTTSWDAPFENVNIDGSYYVQGATYVVYGRNIGGEHASQASQPAHLIVTGGETATEWDSYNYEGWLTNNESGDISYYMYFPFTDYNFPASGSNTVWFGQFMGGTVVGRWNGITRQTPVVPDSTVRQIEFSVEKHRYG